MITRLDEYIMLVAILLFGVGIITSLLLYKKENIYFKKLKTFMDELCEVISSELVVDNSLLRMSNSGEKACEFEGEIPYVSYEITNMFF